LLEPSIGIQSAQAHAARSLFDWHIALWDLMTGAIGLWYLSLRGRFPALVRGAAMFEDLKERRRQALEIHDNIVQGLASAKLAYELGNNDDGYRAIEETLAASRVIITDLLGEPGSEIALGPGDLRRTSPASGAA
jgi:signal transduction histidine kinase